MYHERKGKSTSLGDTAEITGANESKYLPRARREQGEHSAIKQTGTNTDTRLKISLNSGQLLSAHLWALTSLIFHRHCIVQHYTHRADTRTDFQTREQTRGASPVCALSTGLQIPPQTHHSNTADLLPAFNREKKRLWKSGEMGLYCSLSFPSEPRVNSSS